MGQGPQDNESAVEQAKDEQISDFIRSKYKSTSGMFPRPPRCKAFQGLELNNGTHRQRFPNQGQGDQTWLSAEDES
jgi:hypothetical protein